MEVWSKKNENGCFLSHYRQMTRTYILVLLLVLSLSVEMFCNLLFRWNSRTRPNSSESQDQQLGLTEANRLWFLVPKNIFVTNSRKHSQMHAAQSKKWILMESAKSHAIHLWRVKPAGKQLKVNGAWRYQKAVFEWLCFGPFVTTTFLESRNKKGGKVFQNRS